MENLYSEGFNEYPLVYVIFQNIFFVFYFGIGFWGMWELKVFGFPLFSFFYAVFLIVMLIFVLRRELCTNCYYYGKRCSTGWGKLSSFMFKKGTGNYKLGVKLAGITWGFASLFPVLGIIVVLVINFSFKNLILLLLFVSLTLINILIHKESCKRCKMRFICPASM